MRVLSLIIGAAVGFIAFGATFGLLLTGVSSASEAAANGTTGTETGDAFLELVPILMGIAAGLIALGITEKLSGQKFL